MKNKAVSSSALGRWRLREGRTPPAPRAMRRLLQFYLAPHRHAHPSWAAADITIVSANTDTDTAAALLADAVNPMRAVHIVPACTASASPLPDVADLHEHAESSYAACWDYRAVDRFAEAVGRVMGGAPMVSESTEGDEPSVFSLEQRRLLHGSAALLAGPHAMPPSHESNAAAEIGAGYLARGYARLAPAFAARLRLLLPYESVLSWMHTGPAPLTAGEARALDRIWTWGRRQGFW
jgi:hypothetical protein